MPDLEADAETEPRAVAVVTLGCPKNLADSESMLGQLHRAGFRAGRPEEAELIVVNTCAFLTASQQESIDTILELARLKSEGPLQKLVVAGCLSQRHGESILDEMPEVDYLLGPGTVREVAAVAAGLLDGTLPRGASLGGMEAAAFEWEPRVLAGHRHTAYVKISEGCNNTCSFCIIPQLRGKHRSRPIEDIEAEVKRLVGFGVREITIVAQDTTSYGLDLYKRFALPELLARLDVIPGLEWIRLLYTYPRYFTDELVECFGRLERLVPYVDMPIQHASETVLRRMRRGLSWSGTETLLERLKAIPGMVLRTTVITGFPGETDSEYGELLAFARRFEFDHLGAFAYSTEEGTPAGAMPDQVPEEVRWQRRDELLLAQRKISQRRNRARIGQRLDVLIDGYEPARRVARGRWYGQALEIDGVVRVSTTKQPEVGSLQKIRIKGAGPYDLVGVIEEGEPLG